MVRNANLGPVTWIELFFDGGITAAGDLRPWMATTVLETSNGVYGMALFELWADTPQQVIEDLLAALDQHAFTIASDLRLSVQDRSAPLGDHENTLTRLAQQCGWTLTIPASGTDPEGEIQ